MLKIKSIAFIALLMCSCHVSQSNVILPDIDNRIESHAQETRHTLLGFYNLHFSKIHDSCTIDPIRTPNFHLNSLKFLEETPCSNCLSISNLVLKGDGILELDVTINHPFIQNLSYSAFDVKGIIMFNGSLEVRIPFIWYKYPELKPMFVSWAKRGDWELLNADGYSFFWSPVFNPDSEWPITEYMQGKFAKGTPTANINGYKEFYTLDERHLFQAGYSETRTYRIQTQPGPMVVGYAIDACWEQPTVKPVSNPLTDFPPTANAPEPYSFNIVVNDGEPVTYNSQLSDPESGRIKMYIDQWNGLTVEKVSALTYFEVPGVIKDIGHPNDWFEAASDYQLIDCKFDCGDNCFCGIFYHMGGAPAGWYRIVALVYRGSGGYYEDHAIAIQDYYYDPG